MNTGAEALILTCAGRLFGLFVGQANLEKSSFDYLDLDFYRELTLTYYLIYYVVRKRKVRHLGYWF